MDIRYCDVFRPVDEDAYLRDFIRAVEHKDLDYIKFIVPMIKEQQRLVLTDTDPLGHYLQLSKEDKSRYYKTLTHGLLLSSHQGAYSIAEYLIDQEVDVNAQNQKGDTPLIKACERGHTKLVLLLLSAGADVNKINLTGSSALQWICRVPERYDIVNILLNHPHIDVNLSTHKRGLAPLHIAAEHDDSGRITRALIDNFAIMNQLDKEGNTALHLAAIRGHYENVEHLIKNGVYVNLQNQTNSQTALHHAMRFGNTDICKLLIQCGALLDVKDSYDRTPLEHMQFYSQCQEGDNYKNITGHIKYQMADVLEYEKHRMIRMFSTLCELIPEQRWTSFFEELYGGFDELEWEIKHIPLRTSEVSLSILLQYLLKQWLSKYPRTATFWIINRALRDHNMQDLAGKMVELFWDERNKENTKEEKEIL